MDTLETFVEELKQNLPTKEMTAPGDVVVVAGVDPKFVLFARVGNIERDTAKRDEWWHVHLSFLSVPLQQVVWTLRTEQMTGRELFTMDGKPRFIKAVDFSSRPTTLSTSKTERRPPVLKRIK